MTFTTTIAASGTYDISPDSARIQDVQVTNNGPGIVYYGDIPGPARLLTTSATGTYVGCTTGSGVLTINPSAMALQIEEGMVITGANTLVTDGSVVQSVGAGIVNILPVAVDTASDADLTFTPPAISASNGHPLAVGETVRFSAAEMMRCQRGRRFVADGSGASLTISKTRN